MNPKKLIDLSHKLDPSNISIYPGDPIYTCTQTSTIPKDGYSVHTFSLGSHTGTHVDAPSHWFEHGKTIDQIGLDMLVGRAWVIDLREIVERGERKITWDHLSSFFAPESESEMKKIVVIQTGWSRYWGKPDYLQHYPFLCRHAAQELVQCGVEVLAVDTLSPDEIDGPGGYGVHEVFLGAGKVLVENLNLSGLESIDGKVTVSFIPLSLAGSDGAPVRAFAWFE
ncbi:cyclase family protein [Moniliophthora roreri]|uniref:Cyclase family protein n=1 Tax=Moniliophthora roreri TaxID=221103 RepID=A0A0W0FBI6_MONRR|nr:cyclase family protein [Moniliophthora roreri]